MRMFEIKKGTLMITAEAVAKVGSATCFYRDGEIVARVFAENIRETESILLATTDKNNE